MTIPNITMTLFKSVKDTGAGRQRELSWPDFVKKFSKHKIVQQKADAPVYLTASLKNSRTRKGENVDMVHAIVLDFDGNTDLDFLLNDRNTRSYEWVAASTFSNTKDDQRFRVVVPLKEPVTAELYKECKQALVEFFVDADEASFNLGQSFYLPSRSEDDTAAWSYHNKGIPFDFYTIEVVQLRLDYTKELRRRRQVAAKTNNNFAAPTLDDAKLLLSLIDANMPRAEWLKIGAILKKTFGEDACELFIKWSQTANYNDNSTFKLMNQWDSLRDDLGYNYATIVFISNQQNKEGPL